MARTMLLTIGIIILLAVFVVGVMGLGGRAQQNKKQRDETQYAGTYEWGYETSQSAGRLAKVAPAGDGKYLIYVEASRGAPSHHSGSAYGQVYIDHEGKASAFEPDNKECVISFDFYEERLYVRSELGSQCGFGQGVFPDGELVKTSSEIPKSFIDRSGEEIWFADFVKTGTH